MPDSDHPKLRPVEAFPGEQNGQRVLYVHDPTGMAPGTLILSGPALFILGLMDGTHNEAEIRQAFQQQFGQPLPEAELAGIISQLDAAHFLDSPAFAIHAEELIRQYRESPARVAVQQASYGTDGEGPAEAITNMLATSQVVVTGSGRIAGLIAPHLDYPRGSPCYADAYGLLATAPKPERIIILGTNHYGRATSVVATRKDFETPLGTTRTDRRFLERLEQACGVDLCADEFDHQREHSVELQVLILQHLYGPDRFEMVPILCHDPTGPTGTAPYDGRGLDLGVFARALGELVRSDPASTLIIAGADLSHVGRRFGDDRDLNRKFLDEVAAHDQEALAAVTANQPDEFVRCLAAHENCTRVCSAGCIYALMTALPTAKAELLRYHQAVDRRSATGVTCAAAVFWEG